MSYNPEPGEDFKFDPERVRVRRFSQARDMAKDCASRPKQGKPGSILVSMAGGKKRWVVFEDAGDYISVNLIDTEVLRFYQYRILFRTGGHNSVTTRSVINNLLPAGHTTALEKGKRLFYHAPGAEEPVEISATQELVVRYTGTVAPEDEKSGKKAKAA